MAITAELVCARPNGLRYKLTQDGASGTTLAITTTGAPSPDLLTDTAPGLLKQIAKARTQGYGPIPAGALGAADAQWLWLSLRQLSPAGQERIMTARCEITPRTGTTDPAWDVDAAVDGSGYATLNITGPAAAAVAYLDLELEGGAIGA